MSAIHPADGVERRPLYRTEYEALGRLDMFGDEKVELLGGVPDYWVVDVGREEIVVHREPASETFRSVSRHRDGVGTALHHLPVAVDVRALLR